VLSHKLDELLLHHNTLLRGLGAPTFEKQALLDRLLELAPLLLPFAEPVWALLEEAHHQGKRVLFEGAQAVMLDVDHGTYPFVTSSNTVAGNAAAGAGVGPKQIGYVLGIAKAYTTRVGSGPFPTELHDATGKLLGERGREFGTVTGRPRRCGWFDACMVRQAVKVGGIEGLVLTKLDVLDGLPELRICTGYRIGGEVIEPRRLVALDQELPVALANGEQSAGEIRVLIRPPPVGVIVVDPEQPLMRHALLLAPQKRQEVDAVERLRRLDPGRRRCRRAGRPPLPAEPAAGGDERAAGGRAVGGARTLERSGGGARGRGGVGAWGE
jgi:hypothetical protein